MLEEEQDCNAVMISMGENTNMILFFIFLSFLFCSGVVLEAIMLLQAGCILKHTADNC